MYKNPYTELFLEKKNLILRNKCFKQDFIFLTVGNIYPENFSCLYEIWDLDPKRSQKELAKPHSQISNIYFRKGNHKFKLTAE
jgi:hypothetical protein